MGYTSGTKQSSGERETALSKEQAKIVKSREALFNRYIWPELRADIQATSGEGQVAQWAQPGVADVNRSFQSAQRGMERSVAQRGLVGSGFEAAGVSGLQQARAGALADAFSKARMANKEERMKLLQMGGAFAPTPTQAAPTLSSSRASGGESYRIL